MVLQHCQKGFFFLFFFKELAHTTGNNTECLIDQVRLIASANKKPCMNVKQQCTYMSTNSVNTRHTFLKNPDTLHKYANRHTFLKTQTLYTCRPIDSFFSRLKHFTPESQQIFFFLQVSNTILVCQQTHFSQDSNTLHQYANRHFSQDPLYTSMSTDTLFSRPKHFTPVCQQTLFSRPKHSTPVCQSGSRHCSTCPMQGLNRGAGKDIHREQKEGQKQSQSPRDEY